ncbi:hypothetical protein P3T37_003688 [Kitasatospora sp. MAA4]|uniref:hypothetical protein n=1 Tax=Kitasatospora sp. MAA4 TaxID=3035093 RepID=UPI002475FE5A|nr:hypothetical protein [Kitasatospora sp. MAA4]MDH6134286.1 hypothetical protein [Kitasatospora sp. MAA4]
MDIVYAYLERRTGAQPRPLDEVAEVAEVLNVLWGHADHEDQLQHASGAAGPARLDLMLFLRTTAGTRTGSSADTVELRAAALLHRCYRNSALLRCRYLPPVEAPNR